MINEYTYEKEYHRQMVQATDEFNAEMDSIMNSKPTVDDGSEFSMFFMSAIGIIVIGCVLVAYGLA